MTKEQLKKMVKKSAKEFLKSKDGRNYIALCEMETASQKLTVKKLDNKENQ